MASVQTVAQVGNNAQPNNEAAAPRANDIGEYSKCIRVTAKVADLFKGLTITSSTKIIDRLPWTMKVSSRFTNNESLGSPSAVHLSLTCANESPKWSATVRVHIRLLLKGEQIEEKEDTAELDHQTKFGQDLIDWSALMDNAGITRAWESDVSVVVEARLKFIAVAGLRKRAAPDHSAPSGQFDAVLIIEGKKVHVNKGMLAAHSKFFHRLFFSDESEDRKEEYEIDKISHEAFITVLKMLPTQCPFVKESTVESTLAAATQLEMEDLVNYIEIELNYNERIDLKRKLLIADRFKLTLLENECLKQIKGVEAVRSLASSPEFGRLSDQIKLAVMSKGVFADDNTDDTVSGEETDGDYETESSASDDSDDSDEEENGEEKEKAPEA